MTPMSENPVAVTQADRDAAGDIWRDFVARTGECITEKAIRSGGIDDGALVQAFARHRLAGLEREADGAPGGGMGEGVPAYRGAREAFLDLIADAIKFDEQQDESAIYYTLEFTDASLVPMLKALGIEQKFGTMWVDDQAFSTLETPAEAIDRVISEGRTALAKPTPPASVSGSEADPVIMIEVESVHDRHTYTFTSRVESEAFLTGARNFPGITVASIEERHVADAEYALGGLPEMLEAQDD